MSAFIKDSIAKAISRYSKYYDEVVQVDPLDFDSREILNNIDAAARSIISSDQIDKLCTKRRIYLVNGNFNYSFNIQNELDSLYQNINRSSRISVVLYNSYLAWIYKIASKLGIRKAPQPTTFITEVDFNNILTLVNFKVVSRSELVFIPFKLFGLGLIFNKLIKIIPIMKKFFFVSIYVLRPIKPLDNPSLTILIPARNEKGNIENSLKQLPEFPCKLEIIFVEGNSSDGTWEEIGRVIEHYKNSRNWVLKKFKQDGKGKFNAVKKGIENSTCDVITILDADLTMPPELLPQFYNAYKDGHADFVNGSRIVYNMENEAMKLLNFVANKSFSKILSMILDVRIGDSLCGTKMFARKDCPMMNQWNKDFGKFDPFGDFEFIFSAAELQLGIIDVPVRYKARVYGETQISRFRDGWWLLKMAIKGFLSIKLKKL